MGTGLALYGIHWEAQPLKEYLFLPIIGLLLSLLGTIMVLLPKWNEPVKLDLGHRWLYIPLLAITTFIAISGFIHETELGAKFAPLCFGLYLFCIYLVGRKLGTQVFYAFTPFVALVALTCIYSGLAHPGELTGGLITNYCAACGFMIFGIVVNRNKKQWLLATLVLMALFFTGAAEAIFILGVLGLAILVRRDWSKKLLVSACIVVVIIAGWTVSGNTQVLYGSNSTEGIGNRLNGLVTFIEMKLTGVESQITGRDTETDVLDFALTGRWTYWNEAIDRLSWWGHGFKPGTAEANTVHNVPLIVADQVGIPAALAWLFASIACLVKTKWRYAWLAVLAMCVFDHYIWTQFAPYWWALAGVSSASILKTDLIFKG